LGLTTFVHGKNYGYGSNQQTATAKPWPPAPMSVVMVHPDYQYTPLLASAMAGMSPPVSMTWC